jgi:microcystin-dependent protein
MSSPFVAEIRIFGFNFPPKGWAFCRGQLLPISQNTALFSLLGTNYGGDGKSTFGLPDMEGSVPIQQGQGPGLSDYFLGQISGSQNVTVLQSEMPLHNHTMSVSTTSAGTVTAANGNQLAQGLNGGKQNQNVARIYSPNAASATTVMSPMAISVTGSSFPHNNMMPYLALNYCIAMQGIVPARP